MLRISLIGLAVAACVSFTGCASIVSGQNQALSVTAKNKGDDLAGAKCALVNDKGTWYVTTPGSVTVRRSYNDMSVNCTFEGLSAGVSTVKSSTKGMAFGNILLGGVIGAGVDMSTGAAYDYPDVIVVTMGSTSVIDNGAGNKPAEPKADARTDAKAPAAATAVAAPALEAASAPEIAK